MQIRDRKREFQDGASSWLEDLLHPIRIFPARWKIPEITITLIGILGGALWAGVTVATLLLQIEPLKPYLLSWQNGLLWASWVILHIFLAGENGVRFRIWLNLEPVLMRRRDIPVDMTPVSRRVTRIFFFSLLAVEVGFWFWFQILKTQPIFYQEWVLEIFNQDPILYAHEQFYNYWWLLPVLCLAFASAILGLEQMPVLRVYLRRTRLIILFAGVLVPLYLIISFLVWWDKIYPATFG